jgi:glutathione S-transferase
MFTLYGVKGGGSTAVEALLAELGLPHEVKDVERNPDRTFPPWFLKLNPAAQIPVLRLPDDSVMTESAAMMLYLADLAPDRGLAPPTTSAARAQYLRWMVYLSAAVYETDLRVYYAPRYSTDAAHAPAIKAKATLDMGRQFGILADALGSRPYLLGDAFSALDIYAAMLLCWAPDVPALFARHANLKTLHDRVSQRPAVAPIWLRNDM